MSRRLRDLVTSKRCGGVVRKAVLNALADRANDAGADIFASAALLAGLADVSPSTLHQCLKGLVTDGLIQRVGTRPCKSGHTVVYAIDVAKIASLPDVAGLRLPETSKRQGPVASAPGAGDLYSRSTPGAGDLFGESTPAPVDLKRQRSPAPGDKPIAAKAAAAACAADEAFWRDSVRQLIAEFGDVLNTRARGIRSPKALMAFADRFDRERHILPGARRFLTDYRRRPDADRIQSWRHPGIADAIDDEARKPPPKPPPTRQDELIELWLGRRHLGDDEEPPSDEEMHAALIAGGYGHVLNGGK